MFVASMATEMVRNSEAFAAGVNPNPNKFINFHLLMGISRWNMDLPLKHGTGFTANRSVGTKFNGTISNTTQFLSYQAVNDVDVGYSNLALGGINMPLIWSKSIPTVSGSPINLSDALASNLMMIMGVDLLVDSHQIDSRLPTQPIQGQPSITGLLADQVNTPIPAIQGWRYDKVQAYQSATGVPELSLGDLQYTNPLTKALDPFTNLGTIASLEKTTISTALDNLFSAMSSDSLLLHKYLPTTYAQRANAKVMFTKNITNLTATYDALVAKYKLLIQLSINGGTNFSKAAHFLPIELETISNSDSTLNAFQINSGGSRWTGTNFNTAFTTSTTVYSLAEGMALAEYMFTNGYTSVANILIEHMGGVTGANPGNNDHHFYGAIPSTIVTIKQIRAFYACLHELITRFKAVSSGTAPNGSSLNLFDRTVIQVSGDFNRSARTDMTGSDHGYNGANYSLHSGMINGIKLVGKIKSDPGQRGGQATDDYLGSWGLADKLSDSDPQPLRIGRVASTIAAALEIPSPTPNDNSLVTKGSDGKLVLDPTLPPGGHTST
jgi:hypothetical protein